MKLVVTVNTMSGKQYKAITKSFRTFEAFGKYVDLLQEKAEAAIGDDFIDEIEITHFKESNNAHRSLDSLGIVNLIFYKGKIKGCMLKGCKLITI